MTDSPFPGTSSFRHAEHRVFGGLRQRILVSIAATTGWISLLLIFLAFWATRFTLFQDIVVVVVSLLVLTAVLLGAWISFGLRWVDRWVD